MMVSFGSQVDFSVPHLKIRGLNKFYEVQGQRLHALKDINLDIPKAQIVGIIGKSGAGKSSLLRTLNGLESIDTGSILIHQQNIAELSHAELIKTRQKIGMIFQHFNLMSAKTVWENVALPLRIAGYDKAEIEQRVSDVLTLVGLEQSEMITLLNFLVGRNNVSVLPVPWFLSLKSCSVMKRPQHWTLKVPPIFCPY
jgi:D-methionine transport system ATP-binding protein